MCFSVTLEICRELMNSLVSIPTPEAEPGTMSWPSLCQVMRMGMSPDDTTQAMYMSFPTEVEGISKGWMRGGTGAKKRGRAHRVSGVKAAMDVEHGSSRCTVLICMYTACNSMY